ncbi:MAG TPA: OsmC family protein [Pyrinomonadaceae bacterium]|jgi:putative redox protein
MPDNNYKTTVNYAGDDFYIATTPSNNSVTIDTKSDRRSAASPLELLLVSIASCTATDVVSILQKKRQNVTDYKVEITGERRADFPRKFTKFHIHHIVYGRDVSAQAVASAVELSDTKYCSVAATIRPGAEITTSFEIIQT